MLADAYMDHLRAELKMTEAESASICKEIEDLASSIVEGGQPYYFPHSPSIMID